MTHKEMYNKIIESMTDSRIQTIHNWLTVTDFFTAPASHAYHHSYEGGLLEHCVEVFKYIADVNKLYPEINLTNENRFILAFGHDMSKINYYTKEFKNKKIHGEWKSIESYGVDDKLRLGHEVGSIHLLKKLIDVDVQIERAILLHHGAFNQLNINAFSESCAVDDYTFMLHTADMISTKRNERFKLPKIREARGW